MNLAHLLEQKEPEILSQATKALARAHLTHYDNDSIEQNKTRLRMLYKLLVQCIQDNDLIPMVNYAENLAKERFASGFDLQEVQVAFNVLEESLWKQLIKACPPAELAKALGLVSTVQGAGKDALAREYVALASQTKLPSINLEALFNGTTG